MTEKEITKVVTLFDGFCKRGLCSGIQKGRGKKAQFCVEAAIDLASRGYKDGSELKFDEMDENGDTEYQPDDRPDCVDTDISEAKIELNDEDWSSPKARAKGLRNLGILQLGTASMNTSTFEDHVTDFYQECLAKIIQSRHKNNWRDMAQELTDLLDSSYDQSECYEWLVAELKLAGDAKLLLKARAFEYALAKLKTPGFKWLVKKEGYKAPTP